MKVYAVERYVRDGLLKPFTTTLLDIFETREAGLEFCKEFVKKSDMNSKKEGISLVETQKDGADLICNSHVGRFEFLRGYWKEIRK